MPAASPARLMCGSAVTRLHCSRTRCHISVAICSTAAGYLEVRLHRPEVAALLLCKYQVVRRVPKLSDTTSLFFFPPNLNIEHLDDNLFKKLFQIPLHQARTYLTLRATALTAPDALSSNSRLPRGHPICPGCPPLRAPPQPAQATLMAPSPLRPHHAAPTRSGAPEPPLPGSNCWKEFMTCRESSAGTALAPTEPRQPRRPLRSSPSEPNFRAGPWCRRHHWGLQLSAPAF